MKSLKILVAAILVAACSNSIQETPDKLSSNKLTLKDSVLYSEFEFHFKKLDSAVSAHISDTTYACCPASIAFMETNTGIEGQVDGTIVGRIGFTQTDLRLWHKWFNEKYSADK